jgi:hypothetical protein
MNWGYRIVLGFVLFAAFVLTLVFKMVNSGNDLVKAKYFKTGAQVNKDILLHQASASMENQLSINILEPESQTIRLDFGPQPDSLSGQIELICLSNDKADQKESIQAEQFEGKWLQAIRLRHFQKGNWLCEVSGKRAGKEFLLKKSFKI